MAESEFAAPKLTQVLDSVIFRGLRTQGTQGGLRGDSGDSGDSGLRILAHKEIRGDKKAETPFMINLSTFLHFSIF